MIPILYLLCFPLYVAGGQGYRWARVVLIPILLGIATFLATKDVVISILTCATYNMLRFGYGNLDPDNDDKPSFLATLTGDKNGWYIRCLWGLIVSAIGALPLVISPHLGLWTYLIYVAGNGVLSFLVSRLRLYVYVADFIVAAGMCSIVFLI